MGKDLSDPVFDKDTVVHVGADEYTAAPEAYRKFADDMLKYVQDSGRTPRIWGSLSTIKGETSVRRRADEPVELWLGKYGQDVRAGLRFDQLQRRKLLHCSECRLLL